MRYLGLDVHGAATVYCLLDGAGAIVERGSVTTTFTALTELARRLSRDEELTAGQEVGTMCHFVHDIFTSVGVRILPFNAQQLRVIAASRKKTDKRDAFWLAKALQTGMTPLPVRVPDATVRRLRSLLAQRVALTTERKRWWLRARSQLRAAGVCVPKGATKITRMLDSALARPDGLPTTTAAALDLCAHQQHQLGVELEAIGDALYEHVAEIEAIRRLMTIPAVGERVALVIYAAVGDIKRFASTVRTPSGRRRGTLRGPKRSAARRADCVKRS